MTPQERIEPELVDASRRGRIARGSGTQPQEVQGLITQFNEMQRLMKRFGGFGSKRVKSARKDKQGGKGGKAGKGGGRVTSKGPIRMPEVDFAELAERQKARPGGGLKLPGL